MGSRPGSGRGQTMGLYKEQGAEQQGRMNSFLSKYAFFAFDNKQFDDGLKKLGIAPGTEGALLAIPGGGYILADKAQDFKDLLQSFKRERTDAIRNPDTGPEFAYEMFLTELYNTEYRYTEDPEDAIESLGYTMQAIEADPVLKPAFERACKRIFPD